MHLVGFIIRKYYLICCFVAKDNCALVYYKKILFNLLFCSERQLRLSLLICCFVEKDNCALVYYKKILFNLLFCSERQLRLCLL